MANTNTHLSFLVCHCNPLQSDDGTIYFCMFGPFFLNLQFCKLQNLFFWNWRHWEIYTASDTNWNDDRLIGTRLWKELLSCLRATFLWPDSFLRCSSNFTSKLPLPFHIFIFQNTVAALRFLSRRVGRLVIMNSAPRVPRLSYECVRLNPY